MLVLFLEENVVNTRRSFDPRQLRARAPDLPESTSASENKFSLKLGEIL